MNEANIVHLEGSVAFVPGYEHNWTRWKPKGRGQVRFWLSVSREFAGDGFDIFLCAIEPRADEELKRYEQELRAGRMVKITASARAVSLVTREADTSVIFVAEECGFDGAAPAAAHRPRHVQVKGKLAAAGDMEGAELELGITT